MDIKDFNPYVRFCSAVWLYSDYQKAAKAYDYRLFYVLSGGFTAVFEDRSIEVREGGLLLFPPGTAYRLTLGECQKSNHIIVNFDFVSANWGTPTRMTFEPNAFFENEIYSSECIEPFSNILHMEDASFCRELLFKMCDERKASRIRSGEILSAMMKLLLSLISREASIIEKKTASESERLCAQIKDYIKSAYPEEIDNGSIAKKFGYHPYYLNTLFKKTTGVTLHTHITERRLEMAREMLLTTDKSIAEIGRLCGFTGASYFSECFKQRTGLTPSEYRQRAK